LRRGESIFDEVKAIEGKGSTATTCDPRKKDKIQLFAEVKLPGQGDGGGEDTF